MDSRPRALVTLAVVGIALGLAGCGEKGEPPTTGPVVPETVGATSTATTSTGSPDPNVTGLGDAQDEQRKITQAATRFLSSADAAVCTADVTPAFLRKAYGDRAGCVAARKPKDLARSVKIRDIRTNGAKATVTIRAGGGAFRAGTTIELSLVRDGAGTWRVNATRPAPVVR